MNRITAGIKRFTKTPVTLFRIQTTDRFRLRDLASQTEAGHSSYDLILKDGDARSHLTRTTIKACPPCESIEQMLTHDIGPNGASVRPLEKPLLEIIRNWKGKNVRIIQIPEGQ
jgi:hypothetical protein